MWCSGKGRGAGTKVADSITQDDVAVTAAPSPSSPNPSSSSITPGDEREEREQSTVPRGSFNSSWEVETEVFTKELTCILCLEFFHKPVILPCSHNFCKQCIENIWRKKKAFTCPECQAQFSEKKDVQNENTVLQNMVEKLKGHYVGRAQQKCMEHNEPVTLYWKPRRKLACFSCRETQEPKDQSTQFLLIPDAVQIYTEKLISMRIHLRSILVELDLLKNSQKEKISNHKENKLQLQSHISVEFLKLHQFLHTKEKILIKQLNEESEILLQEMETNLKRLQDQTLNAKDTLGQIQIRLYQQNSANFLKEIYLFMDWVQKKTKQSSLTEMVSRSLSPGDFKGPMQYMVWKEMKSTLSPEFCPKTIALPQLEVGLDQEVGLKQEVSSKPEVDLTGISFLTLNPATANPNLVLSEDQTCVRYEDSEQLLPDTPERFSCRASVLGSEGFSSGKHYWEVKVENKTKWTLGVVRESINRQGNYPLSPKAGHWLIKLRNKVELKAVDMPSRCLKLPTTLRQIGVYLDYEGGQVSFYNAEKLTHIYTFMDTFAEKLYPYFCPCQKDFGENRDPLKIVNFDL